MNEYQQAAQAILDAKDAISIWWGIEPGTAHRAALERIATGQAVVVRRGDIEHAAYSITAAANPRPALDLFRAALANQEATP